ncbi:hypothetical protein CRUP_022175, partial [Coryphaenoides rupestris]
EDEDEAHPALHGTSSAECFTLGVTDLSDLTTDVTHHSTAMCAGASGLPIVDTCQPQEGGEQGADTVKEHPAAEDHPSTEDHPSAREDEPTTRSTTEAALVAMETEEEDSVETNVEEEEQGESDCAGLPGVQRSRTHSDGHLLRKRPSEDPNKMEEDAVALPPMNLICEASFSDQVAVGEAQGEEENKEEEVHGEEEVQEGNENEEEVQWEVDDAVQEENEDEEEVLGEDERVAQEEEEQGEDERVAQEEEEQEQGEDERMAQEEEEEEEDERVAQEEEEQGEDERVAQEEEEQGEDEGVAKEVDEEEEEEEEEEDEGVAQEVDEEEEFHEGPEDYEEMEEELTEDVELSMKTPAFVREKRVFLVGEATVAPLPDTLEEPAPPKKQQAKQKHQAKRKPAAGGPPRLPKSYVMSVFKHFAKTRVSTDVYPVLEKTVDAFLERMAVDLETYAHHAKRKTIEVADVELLLRRGEPHQRRRRLEKNPNSQEGYGDLVRKESIRVLGWNVFIEKNA